MDGGDADTELVPSETGIPIGWITNCQHPSCRAEHPPSANAEPSSKY